MKAILALICLLAVLSGLIVMRSRDKTPRSTQPASQGVVSVEPELPVSTPVSVQVHKSSEAITQVPARTGNEEPVPAIPAPKPLTKAERLSQIRESFQAMAGGDPTTALRAARQLAGNERETALMTLLTEWTGGDLTLPQQRGWAISNFGLEAGLGLELAKYPKLAALWANEMTEGRGRAVVLGHAAISLLDSQPGEAFAIGNSLVDADRRHFTDSVFAGWAQKDTEAALRWADQLSDAAERDAATKAIQSEAPVGIGAVLRVQDGYTIIQGVLPGAPAEAGGQLRSGDRIVAMAQGDNAFVDARGMPLKEVVDAMRGAAGTVVQLQVLSADARPDSAPRTISVMRGQIKFKQPNADGAGTPK